MRIAEREVSDGIAQNLQMADADIQKVLMNVIIVDNQKKGSNLVIHMHNEIKLTEEEKRQVKEFYAAAVALLPFFIIAMTAAAFIWKSEEIIDLIEAKLKKG